MLFQRENRKIAAWICGFIFFTKMLISAMPIVSSAMNQSTILQVILQLEIKNNTNSATQGEEVHDVLSKYFADNHQYVIFSNPFLILEEKPQYLKNEKDICGFHPEVPTPPPNC